MPGRQALLVAAQPAVEPIRLHVALPALVRLRRRLALDKTHLDRWVLLKIAAAVDPVRMVPANVVCVRRVRAAHGRSGVHACPAAADSIAAQIRFWEVRQEPFSIQVA